MNKTLFLASSSVGGGHVRVSALWLHLCGNNALVIQHAVFCREWEQLSFAQICNVTKT